MGNSIPGRGNNKSEMPVRLVCSEELRGGLCSSRKEATGVRFHRGSWATGSPEWGARTDGRAGTPAMVSVWSTHTGEERREAGNLMQNCPRRGGGGGAQLAPRPEGSQGGGGKQWVSRHI